MCSVHDSSCGLCAVPRRFSITLQILLDGPGPGFRARSTFFFSEYGAELRHGYHSNRVEFIF